MLTWSALGYEGSYNRVAAFAREWRDDRQRELQTTGRGTFVPLAFEPGEAFQFDWSEDWAIIGNERTKLQVAHTKLSYSRAFIVRAYLLQTLAGEGVDHRQHTQLFAGCKLIVDEVQCPDIVRSDRHLPILPKFGFHPALGCLVPQLQPQVSVNPICSLDVGAPTLALQEHMYALIAVPHTDFADLANTLQAGLISTARGIVVG